MDIIVRGWKKDLLEVQSALEALENDPRVTHELFEVTIDEEDPQGVRNFHDDWEATLTVTTSTPGLSGFVLPVVEAALGISDVKEDRHARVR